MLLFFLFSLSLLHPFTIYVWLMSAFYPVSSSFRLFRDLIHYRSVMKSYFPSPKVQASPALLFLSISLKKIILYKSVQKSFKASFYQAKTLEARRHFSPSLLTFLEALVCLNLSSLTGEDSISTQQEFIEQACFSFLFEL